ncbi:DUF4209 domain-containing protein [Flavobacterium sp. N1994]|uniref:DUF4209 domain-containing protein n=1 Tax=Flavobacterium sp. N1994 TaxID=2986827 RepID=UPI00222238D0|nr:DUF4209 domain-containing protein [Flavobacterium sp. N1994]
MRKHNDIKSFYLYLEELKSIDEWKILANIPIVNVASVASNKKITIERKVLSFYINDGELKSNLNLTNSIGNTIKFQFFNTNEIVYIEKRLNETNNLIMKAKYSHIIWQETKNIKFAEIAIDNYFELLKSKQENDFFKVIKIVASLLFISCKSKHKREELKKFFLELASKADSSQKSLLLNLFVKLKSHKNIELKELIIDIPNWYNDDYFFNSQNLSLGLDLYKKLNIPQEELYLLLAKNEDQVIEQHSEDSFIRLLSFGKKCRYLKHTTQEVEYQKCSEQYNQLKKVINLGRVQVAIDEELNLKINEYVDKKTEAILKYSTEEILAIFSFEESILVDPKENKKSAEKTFNNSFQRLVSVTTLDINLNFSEPNESQKLENQIFQNYLIGLQLSFFILFIKVFRKGILDGHFTYQKIYDYLHEYTWYQYKFERVLRNNKIDEETNWITLIAPGLYNFFTQYEISMLLSTNKVNNYILALDSLTLKFEGALRDFIRLCGGNSTKVDKDGLMKEQLLEELIDNDKIKELFTERDIELFKFTFTRKGKDIRNNIAHAFFSFSNYSFDNVALVFLCFLRLGKYNLVVKQ